MVLSQENIDKGNLEIAQLLGWVESSQKGTWFKSDDDGRRVVHTSDNPHKLKPLPFNTDFNYLQQARQEIVLLTGKKISEVAKSNFGKIGYEVNVATLRGYDWEWVNHDLEDGMTPIELLFTVIAELAEAYNKQNV